jgi:hypothetical protein
MADSRQQPKIGKAAPGGCHGAPNSHHFILGSAK